MIFRRQDWMFSDTEVSFYIALRPMKVIHENLFLEQPISVQYIYCELCIVGKRDGKHETQIHICLRTGVMYPLSRVVLIRESNITRFGYRPLCCFQLLDPV